MSEELSKFYDDELTLFVATKQLVKQLQVSSVKKIPKELISTATPELLFKAEEAIKIKRHQTKASKERAGETGFSESHLLAALDLETPKINLNAPTRGRRFTETSMAEIKEQAEEKLRLESEALLVAQVESAVQSLVSFHGFDLGKKSFGENSCHQQMAFHCLMHAVAIHTDMHRTSSAHRLRLRARPFGGPTEEEDGRVYNSSGKTCAFGVAPIVGVTINHPFVHRATSSNIESVNIITLWGAAGVAACLTVLHKNDMCIGRLSCHGVTLFPRRCLEKGGDPSKFRVLTPDAKVDDLSHVVGSECACPWSLRELVSDDVYLPPHLDSSRERGEASKANDLWYLGCLGLELIIKAPLTTCNFGRASKLTSHQLEGLMAGRFSAELKQLISSLLLHDEEKRPSAAQVLEVLAPKEAARLRGEDLRGWSKRFPKVSHATYFDDGDDDDIDTDSGDESDTQSDVETEDTDGSDSDTDGGDADKRRFRFGVKEAVTRANKRVKAYNRAAWWASLSEEKRINILHRRKTRRMARARIGFLRFCQGIALFKEWSNRDVAEWYQRVVTMGVLAGHLDPFTEAHKDAMFDFDDELEEEEEEDAEVEGDEVCIEEEDAINQAQAFSKEEKPNRLEGPIGDMEDLGQMLRQLKEKGTYYDLTPCAARHGLSPSLRPCRTGAAGELGGNAASDLEEYKLALKKSKLEQQATISGVPLPVEQAPRTIPEPRQPPPMVPPPHRYETSPYVAGAQTASLEWKANGYVFWAGLEEAFVDADTDFKVLMKTAFAYDEPAAHAEKLLHLRVNRVRDQESLKPIIERTVSSAEPSTPSEAQLNRASCMISLCLVQAFIDTQVWFQVGRHWAASRLVATTRGWLTRKLIRQVWEDAATLARQQMTQAEDKSIIAQDEWRRNMASREAFVRGSNLIAEPFAPVVLIRASRSFTFGLPTTLSGVAKSLRQLKLAFSLVCRENRCSEVLYGTDSIGVIEVDISVVSVNEQAKEVPTSQIENLSPASSYLVCFNIIGEKAKEVLCREDPSWVTGDPPLEEQRTLGDAPDRPTSLVVSIVRLEDSLSLPCVLKFKGDGTHSRSIAHISWKSPENENGDPIDAFRVQRRFKLLRKSPLDETDSCKMVICRWQRVFEGAQCEWTDAMETSNQIEELNTLSCDSSQDQTNPDYVSDEFDYGLPHGFSLWVEFRVAAHNCHGWGKPCMPFSSPIRAPSGLVVSVPEGWIAAYEKLPTSNVVPLPLLQPQRVTDGIFHNFVEARDAVSHVSKLSQPSPQNLKSYSQATDVGVRTVLLDGRKSNVSRKKSAKKNSFDQGTQEVALGRVQDEDMAAALVERGMDPSKLTTQRARPRKSSQTLVDTRPSCKMKKKYTL